MITATAALVVIVFALTAAVLVWFAAHRGHR